MLEAYTAAEARILAKARKVEAIFLFDSDPKESPIALPVNEVKSS